MPLQAFPNPLPGGEGAACPLMTSYPVDLFFGFLTRKKIPPGSAPCKQGLDLHPIVAPACDCAAGPVSREQAQAVCVIR